MSTGNINVHEEVNIIGARSRLSDVAWGAVLAGGLGATVITIILTVLGAGLGLLAVSPWPNDGASAGAMAASALAWIIFVQWASASLGGYLSGRLRHRTTYLRGDETLFRDTAHGFLAWGVGTLMMVGVVACFAFSAASGASKITAAAVQGGAAGAAANADRADANAWLGYYTDTLLRTETMTPTPADDSRGEVTRIMTRSLANGDVAPVDRTYLAQVVARQTGVDLPTAQQRVDATIAEVKAAETKLREAADKARKEAAKLAMYIALSMAIGAFIAALMAALGGKLRDQPQPIN